VSVRVLSYISHHSNFFDYLAVSNLAGSSALCDNTMRTMPAA